MIARLSPKIANIIGLAITFAISAAAAGLIFALAELIAHFGEVSALIAKACL